MRLLFRGGIAGSPVVPASARWSPDGRLVYFLGTDPEGRSSFWAIPSAGGTPTLIVRFDDPERETNRSEFATDGKRLYFTLAEKEGDLWVAEIRRQ